MKILDKYVAKNFMIGYFVAFCVLMGLRVMIDLFVNLDEFTEKHAELTTMRIIGNIVTYYGTNATLYFRDFAGMITVVAAAFSLGKLVRNNELVAVMASGVSLKRVIAPIIILAILLTGLLVVDQEIMIPPLSDKLVRSHDDLPGQETYDMWFVGDENGSLLCSQKFDVQTQTLYNPTIILRAKDPNTGLWMVTARIDAEKAVYNSTAGNWDLTAGLYAENSTDSAPRKVKTYITDLKPRDIPVRIQSQNKTLMSWEQLRKLALQGTKIKDQAKLHAQMQAHVTDPAINLVMLMISLPVLVVRDPKAIKSAVLISFLLTGACMIMNFVCKLLATEEIFGHTLPEFWTWLPVLIFLPIAILEFDSMKT
ncbi:MAG: LptF/LptG family permease [Phycisphaerae bacterium]|nr:LptF/LptG family permease [Phycisphaerae bacterium]